MEFLLLSTIRKAIGLDDVRLPIFGASPLVKTTWKFFLSAGINILALYGMTETTGPPTRIHAYLTMCLSVQVNQNHIQLYLLWDK